MSIQARPERFRRPRRYRVEALEPRSLLSVAPIFYANMARSARAVPAAADVSSPLPVPHEQVREAFDAKFSGRYIVGPGRFTDQAFQIYISGGGTASAFLHGNLLMEIFTPVDPASPTTGAASLVVKNVSNTGNLLGLTLQGDPVVDRLGRPTHMTWTVNGSSGGTFNGATGQGTVEIRYTPSGKLPPRALGAGGAAVIFRGQVNTTGIGNILRI
jgi:hypothetical protein